MITLYERIARAHAVANAKYDKYLGEWEIGWGGKAWAYAGCDDLEVFYWHKVVKGQVQKKRFALGVEGDEMMARIIKRVDKKKRSKAWVKLWCRQWCCR